MSPAACSRFSIISASSWFWRSACLRDSSSAWSSSDDLRVRDSIRRALARARAASLVFCDFSASASSERAGTGFEPSPELLEVHLETLHLRLARGKSFLGFTELLQALGKLDVAPAQSLERLRSSSSFSSSGASASAWSRSSSICSTCSCCDAVRNSAFSSSWSHPDSTRTATRAQPRPPSRSKEVSGTTIGASSAAESSSAAVRTAIDLELHPLGAPFETRKTIDALLRASLRSAGNRLQRRSVEGPARACSATRSRRRP